MMDFYHRGRFQRKYVLYGEEQGNIFKSGRKCFKFSLPDLSGIQMHLTAVKKGLFLKTPFEIENVLCIEILT